MRFLYTILFITALHTGVATAQNYEDIFVGDTINYQTTEEEDSLSLDDLEVVTDMDVIQYDMPEEAINYGYVADEDSIIFDLPESMNIDIDSMLNSWQTQHLLKAMECESKPVNPRSISDTVYAQRLYSMPTIMDMTYNSVVQQYIYRYAGNNSTQVSCMLGIAEHYMPMIEEKIDKYNLPHELKYLPVIESALKPKAVSHAGAKGLWQFMFGTSKLYGLKSNNYIEERFDPIKSTDAALRYLRDLHTMFGRWDLAIAAYNCGPGNVKKAIMRSGGKNSFWEIYRYLPRETRGYLPAFIAANYIMTYHAEHGIRPMEPEIPIATDTLHISKNLHFSQISDLCNININEIRAINPQYIRDIIPGEGEMCVVRLPHNTISKFIELGDSIYRYKQEVFFPRENVAKMLKDAKSNNEYGSGGLIRHKIRNGETLGGIALKYRVSVKQLRKWNNIKGSNIRAGRYLKIYK